MNLFNPETLMNMKGSVAYLSVCFANGNVSVLELRTLALIAKLNINHPLPMQWDVGNIAFIFDS